ncbi:MAG: hypothetical protein ACYDGR_00500 [Candidatus Dormibacteria bacterium]
MALVDGPDLNRIVAALVPLVTVLISLAFATQVWTQYRERRKPHQLAWSLALFFYAIAAAPEVLGAIAGWGQAGYRVYYLFGGVLLVPWLSLGTAELLLRGNSLAAYRAFVYAVTAVGVFAVLFAVLHVVHLNTVAPPSHCTMWCKDEAGYGLLNGLAALAAGVGNAIGTVVLVGGAGYSAFRSYRAALPRVFTYGQLLILLGALVVAVVSTGTRFGSYDLFYPAQAVGIAVIFAGFRAIGSASPAVARQPA